MSCPISIAEVVRVKNQPDSEHYRVDRIYPDTHRAQVHSIGMMLATGKPERRIIPLDDLIAEDTPGDCGFGQRAV